MITSGWTGRTTASSQQRTRSHFGLQTHATVVQPLSMALGQKWHSKETQGKMAAQNEKALRQVRAQKFVGRPPIQAARMHLPRPSLSCLLCYFFCRVCHYRCRSRKRTHSLCLRVLILAGSPDALAARKIRRWRLHWLRN